MLKNYFTIAIRHLVRRKLFSIITIFCLAIGITFSMIIGVYILGEKQVNSHLRDAGNQYVIKSKWKVKGMGLDFATVAPLAKTIKEEYPQLVANYYRYNPIATVVEAGEQHFTEDVAIGDTTLVAMYGFPVLYGNKNNAFPTLSSIVITESMAQKLFGRKDVINKNIGLQTTVDGSYQEFTVSAVLKDIPYNSVTGLVGTNYNMFVPTVGNRNYQGGDPAVSWQAIYEVSLIELQPGVLPKDLVQPFRQTLAKYENDVIKKNLEVELAPIKEYHLKENNGTVEKMITTLSLIAGFILLMAIINFVNINIGTSSYRLKEIGLRKVFGSARKQLIFQFIIEAWSLTFIAAVISVGLYELLRPLFDGMLNTTLATVWQFNGMEIGFLLLLVATVGFISGIYPAFILSAANVLHSVKGKIDTAKGGLALRKGLLVLQFTLAIIVFISAVNVARQVAYMFHKDLGYHKEQLLVATAVPKQWDSAGVIRMENVKRGLLQLPVVKTATLAFEIPERKPPPTINLLATATHGSQPMVFPMIVTDEDYAATFGLQVEEGSFFHHGGPPIPGEIVLNESAVTALGLTPGAAVGAKIKMRSNPGELTVAGVIKDYNYSSLQHKIEPLVFMHVNDSKVYRFLTLKLNTPDIAKAVEEIKAKWKELSPNAPLDFFFMDDKLQSLYRSELQLKRAATIATVLNLIIVFLGVFGIVAFTLAKRNKEIAVRKVLGADVGNIIWLFVKDYAGLIGIANLIAWPLAYNITSKWLENYAYRVGQDVVPYLSVCVFIFMTAFALITAQCFKTAQSNPVISLRTE